MTRSKPRTPTTRRLSACPGRLHRFGLAALCAVGCASSLAADSVGRDWEGDSKNDAGDTADTAQKVVIDDFSTLSTIKGELKGEDGGGLAGLGDYQDCYVIVIRDPGTFAIQTTPPFGSTEFDSLLGVYTLDGRALLANEDAEQGQLGSRVGRESSGGEFTITRPGAILISISGALSRPVNADGLPVFQFTDDPTDVVGPNPGVNGPFTAWDQPGQIGNYVIQLISTAPLPSGCAATNTESCFVPHAAPYCNDDACCAATCTVEPFCCDVTWDATCVQVAQFLCGQGEGGCGDRTAESCYKAHETPYCDDPVCCALVCEQRPVCCSQGWDEACVSLAEKICPPLCNEDCPADLDFDGEVAGSDLAIVLGSWGQEGCADLDGSGTVDGADISIVLGAWGSCKDS